MPQPPAEEPLVKVTLNLNAADVEWFRERFGYGWTTAVRNALRARVKQYQEMTRKPNDPPRTR